MFNPTDLDFLGTWVSIGYSSPTGATEREWSNVLELSVGEPLQVKQQ